jgi:3-methyladenine DNA glycosylase AlkD
LPCIGIFAYRQVLNAGEFMTFNEIITELQSNSNPGSIAGMASVGIAPDRNYGVKVPVLRAIAQRTKRNHELALQLWEHGYRETRILTTMIAEPCQITPELLENWLSAFNDWEICDQCCMNLFEKLPDAWQLAVDWSRRPEEFVRRAGFVLMARLAVSDKKASDERFEPFFPLLVEGATDNRNFVKKAVNWAVRQIGKRNAALNRRAIEIAQEIQRLDSKAAKWIAADALRELQSPAVQTRLTIQALKTKAGKK